MSLTLGTADGHETNAVNTPAVYVYEAPVRIWHWVNAICIAVLGVTGYIIANPPFSVMGEASQHFFFGYTRFIHFTAGQILAVAFLYRVCWAFFGNHHSRQLFYFPFWSAKSWGELGHELAWYLFLTREPKKYVGHNPLAQFAMFFLFVLPMLLMILTGLAMYAEGLGTGSTLFWMFGWVIDVFGGSMQTHTFHHLGMWALICFAIVHIYVAIREDIMSRQSLVSTMISGWRMFKDDRP